MPVTKKQFPANCEYLWYHNALESPVMNTTVPSPQMFLLVPFSFISRMELMCVNTRGPRVHYVPLLSRREWKITPLCLIREGLHGCVKIKGPEVCEVSPHPPCFVVALEPKKDSLRKQKICKKKNVLIPHGLPCLLNYGCLKGIFSASTNMLYFVVTITALQLDLTNATCLR